MERSSHRADLTKEAPLVIIHERTPPPEVAAVFHDVDGSVHLAVTLDDDPAAELNNWYGRFHYFRPDELEPLEPAGSPDEPSAPAPAAAPARHTSDSETPAAEAE